MFGMGSSHTATADALAPMPIKGGPGWRPREMDAWVPGLSLAVAAHLLLLVALSFAVHWNVSSEVPVEAELWSDIPRGAQPVAEPPPPVAVPPQPVEPPVAPPPETVPDIVVDKTPPKKVKENKRKEPTEVFDTTPPKVAKKPETKPDRKDEAKKDLAKEAKEKAALAQENARQAAEREAQRRTNLARIMSEAGGSGSPGASGGPSANYAGRIKSRIKPNIVFTEVINGNPVAKVEVRCAPDGRIISIRLVSSSGVSTWDSAVLRAVERTEVLPTDERGMVPSPILLEFRPQDF